MTASPSDIFRVDGRVALVTGASQGIGLTLAGVLAAAGAHVIMVARNADALEKASDQIREAGGSAETLVLDVTVEDDVIGAFDELSRRDRSPDILVNNAASIDRSPLVQSTTQNWRSVLEVNLTAPYVLARTASVSMRRKGWGRIINISSILALHGKARAHSYTATKHAIAGLTRSLCAELGRDGVLVNAICPGYIRTEFNSVLQKDNSFSSMVESRVPLGRWGETCDLAGPLLLLASDACSFINGHLLVVDGGMTVTH